jgi:F-type H+-transporting ATPase subunit gamma
MPSLKAIRKRITSVKSTQKITRAMKMIAGARLAKAQARIVALRPYALKTTEMLSTVVASGAEAAAAGGESADGERMATAAQHLLLAERPEKNVALFVLTSDRGSCGAFNTNISRAAERAWRERSAAGQTVELYTIGRKGRDYLRRRHAPITQEIAGVWEQLDFAKARRLAQTILPRFERGEIDAIYIVYNEFKSAMSQQVVVERVLPVPKPAEGERTSAAGADRPEYLFEPDRTALFERLIPMYVEVSILRALLESMASELGARMTAMDAATKNAKEMISALTLAYNRARQASITKELMEIIGGAEALRD